MSEIKKITIITPCYNSEKYIRETVESVLYQTAVLSGDIELQYIICDGHSTDKTLEIINEFNHPDIEIISEKDSGMYDALAKGLIKAEGEVLAYINAGDYYHKTAFSVVIEIMRNYPDVKWLTGMKIIYNEKSSIIAANLPHKYRRRFFKKGYYGRLLPFLQQESTFWSKELIPQLDFKKLSSLKYAGDYYLWYTFAHQSDLYVVNAYAGGFKYHTGQLSEDIKKYKDEMIQICKNKFINPFDYFLIIFDYFCGFFISDKLKAVLNKNKCFIYNLSKQKFELPNWSSIKKHKKSGENR